MDSDTETAEPPRKKRRSAWDILCPEDSTTLFHTIIFGDEKNEVNKWLLFLENDTWNAKIMLIQLFFDVAGYNHINIKDFFMNEHEKTINDQSLYPNIEKTEGKYFLNVNTNRFLILAQKLGCFTTILAKELFNKKLLPDKKLVTIFLKIWRQMTERNLCAMFHTGIFFATKFKTGLIEIDREINESCSKYQNQSKSEELVSTRNICKKYIKFIDKHILHGKWNLQDPKLCQMRYQCTQEIREWMDLYPYVYINKEHIEYLVAGMKDQSNYVRFYSLDTFYFAFKRMDYKFSELSQNLRVISGRLYDLNIKVAVLAVEVLNYVGMNCNGLPEYIDKKILDCVYSSYAELADTCGNYLIEKYKDNRPEETLLELVAFQIESEQKNSSRSKTALLVGAVMNHVPFLQDVYTYILALRNLTEMNADSRSKTVLLEMLEEVFQLVLFGEPTYKRHNFVCPVSKSNVKNIIIGFYNYLDDIKKFYSTKDLIKILREITHYFGESQENHDEIYEALME